MSTLEMADPHKEHHHTRITPPPPGRDLGMLGALIHVIGDAINNIGVIVSAVIIWQLEGPGRYYADPAISVFIAVMIFLTAIPLTRRSGRILLQTAPSEINIEDVKQDLEKVPGIKSIHKVNIWQLDQSESIASVHLEMDEGTLGNFMEKARIVSECLGAYGIQSVTIQPQTDPVTGCSPNNLGQSPSS